MLRPEAINQKPARPHYQLLSKIIASFETFLDSVAMISFVLFFPEMVMCAFVFVVYVLFSQIF